MEITDVSKYGNSYTAIRGGISGYGSRPVSFSDLAIRAGARKTGTAEATDPGGVPETANVSLEEMLKAKYPNLAYHVADASSSLWRTRNDYPHELIFQQGRDIADKLENWKPSGPNPQFCWYKGPPASKAVVIHPDAQKRMETDPEFATEVMARIEAWWAFDKARNEAIMPGSTFAMSQGVAIGKDGSIVNVVSGGGGGGRITYSVSGGGWWELRAKRHEEYMRLWQERQIERDVQISNLFAAQEARTRLLEMIRGGLAEIFGDTVAGTPTSTMLELAMREAPIV